MVKPKVTIRGNQPNREPVEARVEPDWRTDLVSPEAEARSKGMAWLGRVTGNVWDVAAVDTYGGATDYLIDHKEAEIGCIPISPFTGVPADIAGIIRAAVILGPPGNLDATLQEEKKVLQGTLELRDRLRAEGNLQQVLSDTDTMDKRMLIDTILAKKLAVYDHTDEASRIIDIIRSMEHGPTAGAQSMAVRTADMYYGSRVPEALERVLGRDAPTGLGTVADRELALRLTWGTEPGCFKSRGENAPYLLNNSAAPWSKPTIVGFLESIITPAQRDFEIDDSEREFITKVMTDLFSDVRPEQVPKIVERIRAVMGVRSAVIKRIHDDDPAGFGYGKVFVPYTENEWIEELIQSAQFKYRKRGFDDETLARIARTTAAGLKQFVEHDIPMAYELAMSIDRARPILQRAGEWTYKLPLGVSLQAIHQSSALYPSVQSNTPRTPGGTAAVAVDEASYRAADDVGTDITRKKVNLAGIDWERLIKED